MKRRRRRAEGKITTLFDIMVCHVKKYLLNVYKKTYDAVAVFASSTTDLMNTVNLSSLNTVSFKKQLVCDCVLKRYPPTHPRHPPTEGI